MNRAIVNQKQTSICFKGSVGEISERRGGTHTGFSERVDQTTLILSSVSMLPRTESQKSHQAKNMTGESGLASERQTDRQTDRLRETGRQADRQTPRQRDRQNRLHGTQRESQPARLHGRNGTDTENHKAVLLDSAVQFPEFLPHYNGGPQSRPTKDVTANSTLPPRVKKKKKEKTIKSEARLAKSSIRGHN